MCLNNNEGQYPSCIEAKWGGPGCEDHVICNQCADTIKGILEKIHDLAGQIADHPHAGAIQALVHQVLPCK